ncbi:Uncharacterised protein [Candidatus Bartonella washoeensis]|uniref:Uncharacterized protein n=2 Tax=Candidatus Bartonella washoeensis TaxID=186739 RepID=J1JMT9_9HYPH|nr:hypothetical protein MCQ_00392 [Bartonella washoeensis Sb944nv]EJF85605.1 hypothetical protein MCW_00592 [Bartonella washoeensis 085-0475]SPU27703.1 Uncharacterised protein [Bartonella washoeensis]
MFADFFLLKGEKVVNETLSNSSVAVTDVGFTPSAPHCRAK